MSTNLTTPQDLEKVIHTQDIPHIHMAISNGQLEYHVDSYDEDGEVLAMKAYTLNFADAPPAVKDHLRAVLDDVR